MADVVAAATARLRLPQRTPQAWLVHFQAMNPLFADGQPWDSLFYLMAAVVVVIVNRKSMLRRGGDAIVGLEAPITNDRVSGEKSGSASTLIPA